MKKKQKVDYNAPAMFKPESQSIAEHLGEIVMGLAAFKTGENVGQATTIGEIQSKLGSFGCSLLSKILGDMCQCLKCRARRGEDAEEAPRGDRKAVEIAGFDEAIIPDHSASDVYDAFGLGEHEAYDMDKLLAKFGGKSSKNSEFLYSMMNAVGRRANPDFDATKRDALMVLLGRFIGCNEDGGPKVSVMCMPGGSLREEVKDALRELIGK